MKNDFIKTEFNGTRLNYRSKRSFDTVLKSLLDQIGHAPVDLTSLSDRNFTWSEVRERATILAGPSGFMLFGICNHGEWMLKTGIARKAITVVLGNPVIAETMLRHDMNAGLSLPVEFLIIEEAEDECALVFVLPSSLVARQENKELRFAALALDRLLKVLASVVTQIIDDDGYGPNPSSFNINQK